MLRKAKATKTKAHFTKQVQFQTSIHPVIAMTNHVTKLFRGHNIDADLLVRVLTFALGMHRFYALDQKRGEKRLFQWKNLKNNVQIISHFTPLLLTLFEIACYTKVSICWVNILLGRARTKMPK